MEIRHTSIGVVTTVRMARRGEASFITAEIPGASGAFPSSDLVLHDPVAILRCYSPCIANKETRICSIGMRFARA
jgi:hypothetical protein